MRKTTCLLLTAAVAAISAPAAYAGEKIYSPYVEQGELEIEYFGTRSVDGHAADNNAQAHELSAGYGINECWRTEVASVFEKDPEDKVKFHAWEWENIFQLTDQNEYWVDAGALVAYEWTPQSNTPDTIEARLMLAKNLSHFSHTFNAIFGKEVGASSGPRAGLESTLLWSSRYRYSPYFQPGFEISSELGELKDIGGFEDQQHAIGPAIYGKIPVKLTAEGDELGYRVAYLVGVSDAAPSGQVAAQLEYELHF